MGMPVSSSDALIVICMAVFFTTVVRAPVTGVLMTVELTWNFMFLLPALIGVAAGYLIGDVFRVRPVYERLLDEMLAEGGVGRTHPYAKRYMVAAGSPAAERTLRDLLLPADVRITSVERGGRRFIPDGNARLLAGDTVVAEGELADGSDAPEQLAEILGPPAES